MRSPTFVCLLVIGCQSKPPAPGAPLVHQEPVGSVKQVMSAILEPAADVYWDAVGSVADKSGIHEFAPKSDEEWNAVWRAALTTAETGNLLMMDGRAYDRAQWMTFSKGLIAAGRSAMAAAAAHNRDSVFDAGARLYEACTACHAVYWVGRLPPADSARSK